MSVYNCARAHRTRLKGYIYIAVPKPPTAERLTGIVNCVGFCVQKRVLFFFSSVPACSNDFAITHNHRTDRHFVILKSLSCKLKRLFHILYIKFTHSATEAMIVSRIKITTIVAVPALVKKHFIFSLSERETTFEVSLMLRKFLSFFII